MRHGHPELTSANGPERAHKPNIKAKADCMSTSAVPLTILRHHARQELLESISEVLQQASAQDEPDPDAVDRDESTAAQPKPDKDKNTPCELGLNYPILLVALNPDDLHLRISVRT